MKQHIYVLLVVFMITGAGAQEYISLKTAPFMIENSSFHVEQVLDKRNDAFLGTVKNLDGDKVRLQLQEGAAKAVQKFIDVSLPFSENTSPVRIEIKALEVTKSRINEAEITARAHVTLAFLIKKEGVWQEQFTISHNEDQIFTVSIFALFNDENIFKTHEKRIRAALEYCLHAFAENYQTEPTTVNLSHFSKKLPGEEIRPQIDNWYNLITFRQLLTSQYYEGWAVGYTGFADSNKGFIVPYEISFEQYSVKSDKVREQGYNFVDSYILRPGLYGYKKIIPGVYASIGANVPFGLETLEDLDDDRSLNFVIGLGASQGIKVIPWKNLGVVLGIDFFQQIKTSRVFDSEIGLELILGINF